MYNPNYSQKAIPLVAVNQHTGKYEMTQQAIKFMRSVPAPLGVVSVAGLYRTGKSYLLNRMLLNTNKPKQGFGVGPTINPCTKGLWCWGTPIKGKSQNGQSINIIVIDTQGIGALDQDQTHDTRIFTLAILASSCFIYNSVGSIDETAVQNLSLVVNLTKHIQLKSTNKSIDQDEDTDEMAHYFPSFYWVVRDFSLQLQDVQGNTITSKQYLQKALAPLKGSSQFDQDIEQKNRIRKLLTSFFKDRDCFTMVRPLVDETKLQDLDGIPFEELRPDFIQQVIGFRKRVTQGLKIKTLNGKQLNGDMYCNMMSSYVGAINQGAVPNIQNAWNYMCQEQCQKIQQQCENIFDKQVKDNMKYPVQEQYFENTCQHAFDICMMNFREKSIGQASVSLKYEKELKQRIKQKIKNARQDNAKASRQYLQKKVLQVFNPIMQLLKKQHFKTFQQFQKSISTTYENLVNNSPNLPFTKIKYLQLYKKVQRQGAEYIFKCNNKEIQNLKAIFKEKQDYYTKQLQLLKSQQDGDRKNYSTKISEMDREKIQTQSKIERLQFELDKLIKEKQSQTQKLSKNLTFKQSQFENTNKLWQNKFTEIQQKYQQTKKQLAKQLKIWEKDRTVMQSKIKQQSTIIQQLQKDKQILNAKYDQMTNQAELGYKDNMNKTQKKLAQAENQLKKLKQAKFQLSENLKTIKDQLQQRNDKFQRTQKKLKEQLNSKKRQFENLKNQFELEKKKFQQQLEDQRDKMTKNRMTFNDDYKKQRDTAAQLAEQLRKIKADSQTKHAELQQRNKFLQDQKRFFKQQIEQSKRNHIKAIEDLKMQNTQVVQQRQKIRIQQVRTQYITQIKNVTIQHENQRKRFIYEVQTLRNSTKQMQLELKVAKQQLFDQKNNFKQFQSQTSQKIQSLQLQLKNLQRIKQSTLMEKQTLLKKKIYDLEAEIQYLKEKYDNQHRESEERNKQCIIQLRVTYERQREDLENGYFREKQRAQKKYDEMVEELESKHRQQIQNMQNNHEQQVQQLLQRQDELKSENQQLGYTVQSKTQQNNTLIITVQQLKAMLNKKQQEFTRKIQHLTLSSKQQKQQLNLKLQTLQQQFNLLEKQLMNINHQKQRISNELQKTRNILKQTQDQYTVKRQQYFITLQQYKKKLSEKENQLMELKINYEKQTALLSQEVQHITDKNNQLQHELNRINQVNEQKIKKIKFDAEQTINSTIEKYSTQRNVIQQKYDKNKKTFKDIQSSLNKKLNEMEKQKAVDSEKINNLQMKLSSIEQRRRLEVSNLQRQYEKIKQLYKTDKTELTNEINKLRQQIEDLHRRKLDIETKYDKDTLLLRNEVQNQINIRETRQSSFNETIRQLQSRIDNLQRTKSSEQSKAESSYNQQRVRIQQTYRTKITQSNKIIQKMTRDYDQLSKRYDYESKDLRQMLAVQRQAKQSLQIKLDKKTTQWQEHQRKYNHDLDILKSERQSRGLEFQKQLEKEKQTLKLRLNDLENKLRATQKEKSSQFMQYEREKARFSQQQSNLNQQMQHLKDKISKLEKDKQRLDKDNQRLKYEKRTNKTASYIRFNQVGGGVEQKKSQITIRTQQKIQKRQTSDYKQQYMQQQNKQNISQQMLLD